MLEKTATNNQEIGNLLAAKLQAGRTDCFWKEVRRMNNCKVPLPNCIDGIFGAGNYYRTVEESFL